MRKPPNDQTAPASAAREVKLGARYFAVVVAGFVVDVSATWTLHAVFGLSLGAAAVLGFLLAATPSYFAHEFWTFRRTDSAYSSARAAKFLLASAAILGARLLFIWLTGPLAAMPAASLIRLAIAFGGSLVVGFLVNRLLVFRGELR